MENKLPKGIKIAIVSVSTILVLALVASAWWISAQGSKRLEAELSATPTATPTQGTATKTTKPGTKKLTTESAEPSPVPEGYPVPVTTSTVRPTEEPEIPKDTSITKHPTSKVLQFGPASKYESDYLKYSVSSFDNISKYASAMRVDVNWQGWNGAPQYKDCGLYKVRGYLYCDTNTGYRFVVKDLPKNPLVAIIATTEGSEVPEDVYQRLKGEPFSNVKVGFESGTRDAWVTSPEVAHG